MDGVDAALIVTDGQRVLDVGPNLTRPYDTDARSQLRSVIDGGGDPAAVGEVITRLHADVVRTLLRQANLAPSDVDVIGFHGHTVLHRPERRLTRQIGDGALLAQLTGIDVVADFRSADVALGGQGAPLAPLYHVALAHDLEKPLAVANIGGVGNVTWIGRNGDALAFDTGPGNALIDDWMRQHGRGESDVDGRAAAGGTVREDLVAAEMAHSYFKLPPPKSLDRNDFDLSFVQGLSVEDGAATLTAFTVSSLVAAVGWFPEPVHRWLVCGGGRHNPTLMARLADALEVPVAPVEAVSWRGDALEAEAFAFLAVRSLDGLPLSLPGTTGVPQPTTGGQLFRAAA